MTIRALPPELADQIAAGEVVERPASVVKELVENSIDAGATRVTVEIGGGGIDQIRVTDNGHGIPAGEVTLAFQHHATSKLSDLAGLLAISTLGFRGEALPSIAAVSCITIATRHRDADTGYRMELRWGDKVRAGAYGCPPGTSIQAAELFGNLPARRKFLRSAAAEGARIHELVSRYALAYPEIQFQLTIDGRAAFATPGNGRGAETLLAIFGAEVAAGMLPVSGHDAETGYGVEGFTSAPYLHRANRTYMNFFVNRRWVQNRLLSFALEEAYHDLLPEKRYPLAVLNIIVPYAEVDVNCHPAKREVRFHQERKVYAVLQRGVRAAVLGGSPVPVVPHPASRPNLDRQAVAAPELAPLPASGTVWSDGPAGTGRASQAPLLGQVFPGDAAAAPPDAAAPRQHLPSLNVVGQIKQTYIIAEGPQGMYLVDQHAAHERVLFDQLRKQGGGKSVRAGKRLLPPVTVELTPQQTQTAAEQTEFLRSY
ncbi:MAG: DNA mismatch repair endonuclease MutL, partial [SAR202 cluster bacterium]|nr:DNA mismatch repair endonuclease MutL [SAR202 cluster bacterium]